MVRGRNAELADELIERLNRLIADAEIRADVDRLLGTRVPVGATTARHRTIQVAGEAGGEARLGFLGLLNGLVGVIPRGRRRGWGYICAVMEDSKLARFERTGRGRRR